MKIENTTDRSKVEQILHWSRRQAAAGLIERTENWDKASAWHNDYFRDTVNGKEWVVYLADQAWPGEVRLVTSAVQPNKPLELTR